MVFVWNLLIRPLGGIFDIYELLPAFLLSCIVIIITSYLTPEGSKKFSKSSAYKDDLRITSEF